MAPKCAQVQQQSWVTFHEDSQAAVMSPALPCVPRWPQRAKPQIEMMMSSSRDVSNYALLLEQRPQCVRVKVFVVGDQVNETGEVGEELALIPIAQNRGHRGIVEFHVAVVDLDEVHVRIRCNKRAESLFYCC